MATGITPLFGRPGIGTALVAQRRNVSRNGALDYYPAGGVIEGTKARDPGNSAYSTRSLRAGLLMGKITSGGFWANSIIGTTSGAYTSGGLSLTISAASAAELARRVGGTGTFNLIGPATAAGANNTTTVTFSAIDQSTGVVTISDIGANRIAGCFVTPTDGSGTPRTVIPDGYGLVIPEDSSDVEFPMIPVAGCLDVGSSSFGVIDWPSDATLKTWVRESLSTLAGGKWIFSDQF